MARCWRTMWCCAAPWISSSYCGRLNQAPRTKSGNSTRLCDNNIPVIKQLLRRPQDPDLEDEHAWVALHFACESGCIEAACLLLEGLADKDKATDAGGETPLLKASRQGHLEVVHLLLEASLTRTRPQMMAQLRCTWLCTKAAWKLCACCWKQTLTRTRPLMMVAKLHCRRFLKKATNAHQERPGIMAKLQFSEPGRAAIWTSLSWWRHAK